MLSVFVHTIKRLTKISTLFWVFFSLTHPKGLGAESNYVGLDSGSDGNIGHHGW